jgi:serine phosphatase RsbU (regulator of sigma subunit)
MAVGLLVKQRQERGHSRLLPWLLAAAVAGSGFARVAGARGCSTRVSLGGIELAANTVGFMLFGVVLCVVVLRQLRQAGHVASQLQGELAAARCMQQMLLTGHSAEVPGYAIETAYRPAHEVGGDFFRVLPAPGGAALLVVGDVSGKGLRAAMMVSVLVGALLNRRSNEPAEVLEELNRALVGQMEKSFVTCCAVLLEPHGRIAVASAGHLAPYRGGAEVEIPAGLPLGVVDDASYESSSLRLEPGDQLVLLSDGVLEAASPGGELFGFERTRSVSDRRAEEIAAAAARWGQNDDITVLTVRSVVGERFGDCLLGERRHALVAGVVG